MKKLLIFIVLALSSVSCQKIFFNEEESTRVILLEDFHSVIFSGIYNIVLVQDSTDQLDIKGRNNINYIDAVVRNDTLFIDDNKKISFNPGKNTLYLHFTNLDYIVTNDPVSISNTGIIKTETLIYAGVGEIAEGKLVIDCNYFLVVNNTKTLGYLYFGGKTNSCLVWNRYGSSIFADSLICKDAEVINESVGDVYINACDHIKATIIGSGNIYYYGTPVIEIAEKRGDGKIIRID